MNTNNHRGLIEVISLLVIQEQVGFGHGRQTRCPGVVYNKHETITPLVVKYIGEQKAI